jgi:hypothetical protein
MKNAPRPDKKTHTLPDFALVAFCTEALFTWHANPKYFLFYPSHRIFKRIHGALNVGKKTN